MTRHALIVALGLAAFAQTLPARADEGQDRANWFKSLLQPGTRASCCDLSDCKRTQADWHDGQWWAVVVGQWTPIPDNTILNKRSIDGNAYVCATHYRKIYCFVKPDFGS